MTTKAEAESTSATSRDRARAREVQRMSKESKANENGFLVVRRSLLRHGGQKGLQGSRERLWGLTCEEDGVGILWRETMVSFRIGERGGNNGGGGGEEKRKFVEIREEAAMAELPNKD